MTMKNIEGMKKLLEEKKKLGTKQGTPSEKINQKIRISKKGFSTTKRGGAFDK